VLAEQRRRSPAAGKRRPGCDQRGPGRSCSLASFAEDVAALIGIWMIFHHPLAMLCFVLAFVIAAAWMAPKVWRGLRALFTRTRRRLGGQSGGPTAGPSAAQSRAPEGGGEVTLGGVQGG
jgi:hypothetical protein